MPAECGRAGHAAEQAQHVPRHCVEAHAAHKLALDIGDQGLGRRLRRCQARGLAKQQRIHGEKPPRLLVRRPPHHQAIDAVEVRQYLVKARDATVEHDAKIRMRGFEPIDAGIIERRDIPVLARR